MPECAYQTSLASYYDGQARPELAGEIQRHLPACLACSEELGRLSRLSQELATIRPEPIHPDELARLHEAVRGVEDHALEDRGVLRLVAGLSAMAASVLIIGTAWLYDGPKPNPTTIVREPVPVQNWERIASGGASAQPAEARPTGTAMRDTTNWMIRALGGAGEHDSR